MLQVIKKLSLMAVLMTVVVGLITATSLRLHAPDLPVLTKANPQKINSKQALASASQVPSTKESKSSGTNQRKAPYESASLKVLRKAAREGRLNGSATANSTRDKSSVRHSAVSKNRTPIGPNGTQAVSFTAVRQLELRSKLLSQSN